MTLTAFLMESYTSPAISWPMETRLSAALIQTIFTWTRTWSCNAATSVIQINFPNSLVNGNLIWLFPGDRDAFKIFFSANKPYKKNQIINLLTRQKQKKKWDDLLVVLYEIWRANWLIHRLNKHSLVTLTEKIIQWFLIFSFRPKLCFNEGTHDDKYVSFTVVQTCQPIKSGSSLNWHYNVDSQLVASVSFHAISMQETPNILLLKTEHLLVFFISCDYKMIFGFFL